MVGNSRRVAAREGAGNGFRSTAGQGAEARAPTGRTTPDGGGSLAVPPSNGQTSMRPVTQIETSGEVLRAYPTGAERIVKVTPVPCGLTPLYLGYCHLNVLEGRVK